MIASSDRLLRFNALAVMAMLVAWSLLATTADAQVEFRTTVPQIDGYPTVRFGVTVSESGKTVTGLTTADFTVYEDGRPVRDLQLLGCDDGGAMAVAVALDVSASMTALAGSGTQYFNQYLLNTISEILKRLPPGSQVAVIPFTDEINYTLPDKNWNNGFYSIDNGTDTSRLISVLAQKSLRGNTDIDYAIRYASERLASSLLKKRAMIVISDDAVQDVAWLTADLQLNNISLGMLQLDDETFYPNRDLVENVGGQYFAAADSMMWTPLMQKIVDVLTGVRCSLSYVSTSECPWRKTHETTVTLRFKNANHSAAFKYTLGRDKFDILPPTVTDVSPSFTSRVVFADDGFPCGSGLRSFSDSLLHNFTRLNRAARFPWSAQDSLVVVDSMYGAEGHFVATDSAGNRALHTIVYEPIRDTIPPSISDPTPIAADFRFDVLEDKPWDRGLESISIGNAINFALDSVHFYDARSASAWLHAVDLSADASAELLATDSVGNKSLRRIEWKATLQDILPPQIVPTALTEPRIRLVAEVTEIRPLDRGIQSVAVTSSSNAALESITYGSIKSAIVSTLLLDSLYPAWFAIEAVDSAGNASSDVVRYAPEPDQAAPRIFRSSAAETVQFFSVSETSAWDRGIRSIKVTASPNCDVSPILFSSARKATLEIAMLDPAADASATIVAEDSAGNQSSFDVKFDGKAVPSILPLAVAEVLDFKSTFAPALLQRSVLVTNPNPVSVTLTTASISGDDSVFASVDALPIVFQPRQSNLLNFRFSPLYLGAWRGKFHGRTASGEELVTIDLLGASSTIVTLQLDTIAVPTAGADGLLTLRLESPLQPINIDSIEFDLTYNGDVIELGELLFEGCGTSDTGFCNLRARWLRRSEGKRTGLIVRKDRAKAPALTMATSVLTIPFTTRLNDSSSTAITISNIRTLPVTESRGNPGLVTLGSMCDEEIIRAHWKRGLSAKIESLAPNPGHSYVDVALKLTPDVVADLVVLNPRGTVVLRARASGQSVRLSTSHLASGSYSVLLISAEGALLNSSKLLIEH